MARWGGSGMSPVVTPKRRSEPRRFRLDSTRPASAAHADGDTHGKGQEMLDADQIGLQLDPEEEPPSSRERPEPAASARAAPVQAKQRAHARRPHARDAVVGRVQHTQIQLAAGEHPHERESPVGKQRRPDVTGDRRPPESRNAAPSDQQRDGKHGRGHFKSGIAGDDEATGEQAPPLPAKHPEGTGSESGRDGADSRDESEHYDRQAVKQGESRSPSSGGGGGRRSMRAAHPCRETHGHGDIVERQMGRTSVALPTMSYETLDILVVDDESELRETLSQLFKRQGHRVVAVANGRGAIDQASTRHFDIVLLDVALGQGPDGYEVCRTLRERRNVVPIIMLTALDSEADAVLGLEAGADDYITKPFGPAELRSRIRALLRRAGSRALGDQILSAGGVVLDRGRREVTARDQAVTLTFSEFELLETFMSHPGRLFQRDELLRAIWGDSAYRDPRGIDVHIRHLREKLEEEPEQPRIIGTVRGAGYRLIAS